MGGFLSIFILATAILVGATQSVRAAQSPDGSVTWIVPFRADGGTDRWARFLAPYFTRNLDHHPSVVVKNIPGSGSTKGANHFARRAGGDGSMLLTSSGSTQLAFLLGDPRVQYDYADWTPVFASGAGGVFYIESGLGVQTVNQLKGADLTLTFGSQGATSLDMFLLLSVEKLGVTMSPIFGMKGRAAGRLAFERGEVNSDFQTTSAYLQFSHRLVRIGRAVPLMTLGWMDASGMLTRDPNFPDLPHFAEAYEIVHGEAPSGEWWRAWKSIFALGYTWQKMLLLPKGTKPELIERYRAAFGRAAVSTEFQNRLHKTLGRYPVTTGGDLQNFYDQAIRLDTKSRNWVKTWLADRYDVRY